MGAAGFGVGDTTRPAGAVAIVAPAQFQIAQPAVPIVQRQVCSLLNIATGNGAGILGQDEIGSVRAGGVEYWVFGDTGLSDGRSIPNNIATADATDNPADCVALSHKRSGDNLALPLLPLSGEPDEATVWPAGMVAAQPGLVHFFYASMTTAVLPFTSRFIGLGRFDTATLSGVRLGSDPVRGSSFWDPAAGVTTARPILVGDTVYVFLGVSSGGQWQIKLARVPAANIEDVGAYTYWDAASRTFTPSIADADTIVSEPWAQLPSQVGWNAFLKKWTMVYVSYAGAAQRIRVADELTGPWSEPSTLFDCRSYYTGPGPLGTYCYTGQQHDEYQANGGETIYTTVSNENDYRVFLHEIKLAAPVTQYVDANGQRSYVAAGAAAPSGTSAEGIAFYAGKSADPALTAIHTWTSAGEVIYAATAPSPQFVDGGIAFYAAPSPTVTYRPVTSGLPTVKRTVYDPVYRWDKAGTPALHTYSQFPSVPGFTRGPIAFYAPCPDTDNDGATDCVETAQGTDLRNPDTDGDGWPDAPATTSGLAPGKDAQHDNCPTVFNPGQENHDGDFTDLAPSGRAFNDMTWPNADALGDACDPDADNDGLANSVETSLPGPPCPSASGPLNPLSRDTDGDLFLDGAECALGTDPANALSYPPVFLATSVDSDHDSLPDALERTIGTDPLAPDTDGDGIIDGVEFGHYNSNPLSKDTDGDGCSDGKEIGSVNADRVVNSIDFLAVVLSSPTGRAGYAVNMDLNKDGKINSTDLLISAHQIGYCAP